MGLILALLFVSPETNRTYVFVAELNTYGAAGNTRRVVIYRDPDGSIIAWRWYAKARLPRGRGIWKIAVWEESGRLRMVFARYVVESRTLFDAEFVERRILPAGLRRGLK